MYVIAHGEGALGGGRSARVLWCALAPTSERRAERAAGAGVRGVLYGVWMAALLVPLKI